MLMVCAFTAKLGRE